MLRISAEVWCHNTLVRKLAAPTKPNLQSKILPSRHTPSFRHGSPRKPTANTSFPPRHHAPDKSDIMHTINLASFVAECQGVGNRFFEKGLNQTGVLVLERSFMP